MIEFGGVTRPPRLFLQRGEPGIADRQAGDELGEVIRGGLAVRGNRARQGEGQDAVSSGMDFMVWVWWQDRSWWSVGGFLSGWSRFGEDGENDGDERLAGMPAITEAEGEGRRMTVVIDGGLSEVAGWVVLLEHVDRAWCNCQINGATIWRDRSP